MLLDNKEEKLLFKFSPINVNSIKLLINSQIWFSSFDKLNDPFEGQFEIESMELPNDEMLFEFYEKGKFNFSFDGIKDRIKDIKINPNYFYKDIKLELRRTHFKRWRIACFSQISDEILMWSHYADEHKGICLIFDKEKLINNELLRMAHFNVKDFDYDSVSYDKKERLKVKFAKKENYIMHLSNARELSFTKLKCWEYESEYRILLKENPITESNGILGKFNMKALKGIIFGEKTTNEDIITIHSILTKYEYVNSDFIWGAYKIAPSTGKMESMEIYGEITDMELIMRRNRWLFY